jgi:membrane protease YdiL (CAAX protease family)
MATSHFRDALPPSRSAAFGTALVVALALLPFAVRGAVVAWFAQSYVAQSAYKLPLLAAPVGWRLFADNRRGWNAWWPVREPLPGRRTVAMAVGFAAAFVGAAIVTVANLAPVLGIDPAVLREHLDRRFALNPFVVCVVAVYLFSINAGLEELHYRAWLDRELSRRLGNAVGIGTSAVLFALLHVFVFAGMPGAGLLPQTLLVAALTMAGAAWSWLSRRPGGIHAAWLSHGLTDVGVLAWGLWWLGYFE